jgi:16S rRNA processing protein RimM
VRGEVVVEALSTVTERWRRGSRLTAMLPAAGTRLLEVVSSRRHQSALLVRFADVEDRDAAAELRGAELVVPRAEVPPAAEGSFYYYELAGCRCCDRHAGELGKVVDLLEDGGGLLLLVDDGARRLPIPFVTEYLRRVDVEAGVIELELPAGLIETCASTS